MLFQFFKGTLSFGGSVEREVCGGEFGQLSCNDTVVSDEPSVEVCKSQKHCCLTGVRSLPFSYCMGLNRVCLELAI